MRVLKVLFVASFILIGACGKREPPIATTKELNLPDITIASELPVFAKGEGQIQIANSFGDVDASWVIGAMVDTETGTIYAEDTLAKEVEFVTTPKSEIQFKRFVENSVLANASWLAFAKAEAKDQTRTEITVAKVLSVTTKRKNVDMSAVARRLAASTKLSPDKVGVIVGYTGYTISASYFRDSRFGGELTGYGAKIGGVWYSKAGDSSLEHRIVASWVGLAPLVAALKQKAAGDLSQMSLQIARDMKLMTPALRSNHALIVGGPDQR